MIKLEEIMKTILASLSVILVIACSGNNHDEMKHDNHEHEMNEKSTIKSELFREGVIDVESLDIDKDGNLYECPMDWNVLSDIEGSCPVCGMALKAFSLEDIKKNLDKYGYSYKE